MPEDCGVSDKVKCVAHNRSIPRKPGFLRIPILDPCFRSDERRGLLPRHAFPDLVAQEVDGFEARLFFKVPIGPAIAGLRVLHRRADLVD